MTKKSNKVLKTFGEFISENRFAIIFSVVIVAFLGSMIWLSLSKNIDLSNVDTSKEIAASEKSGNIAEHIYSKNDSKVVLVEYGDYQCPGCKTASTRIASIAKEYKDSVQVIFRNYPITTIHPNALAAATVAEAAGLQGKFWEMHDLLYDKQDEWSSATSTERLDYFTEYAQELGLDISKLKSDMESKEVKAKINFDQAVGAKDNVTGTPSFFLNGKELESDIWGDDAKLKATLDEAIKSSK